MKLSICIATFKRADTIGETLASIVPQLTKEVEVVVFDGASPDDTGAVVARFADRYAGIRYVRADTNSGVDADFDKAVEHALGDHVWLFTDDDVLVDGAVATVLAELADGDPEVLIVDAAVCDIALDRMFEPRRLPFVGRRDYSASDRDAFLADAGNALSFIGGTIIQRRAWLARDRSSFYGSLFVHVGVLFQSPPLDRMRILGCSLVRIRIANAMWGARGLEIWHFLWPDLVWGFDGYSDGAKQAVVHREPWRRPLELLNYRALDSLRHEHLVRLAAAGAPIAIRAYARILLSLPGTLLHVAMTARVVAGRSRRGSHAYTLIAASRFSNPVSRLIARLVGHRAPPRRVP